VGRGRSSKSGRTGNERRCYVKGVEYVIDGKGEARAVPIDLKKHGRLWEDFHDLLESRARRDEPRTPWAEVKARLHRGGILR